MCLAPTWLHRNCPTILTWSPQTNRFSPKRSLLSNPHSLPFAPSPCWRPTFALMNPAEKRQANHLLRLIYTKTRKKEPQDPGHSLRTFCWNTKGINWSTLRFGGFENEMTVMRGVVLGMWMDIVLQHNKIPWLGVPCHFGHDVKAASGTMRSCRG